MNCTNVLRHLSWLAAVSLAELWLLAGPALSQRADGARDASAAAFAAEAAGATATGTADAPAPDAEQSGAQREAPRRAALQAALARHAGEPSVEQVVRASLRAAAPPKAAALASRARTAGWVPRVGLRARRGQTVDLASSQTIDDETLRLSTDDDLTLEASLTFELDRVVFRREEVALVREARAEQRARQERVREVIALYFERKRLQLEHALGVQSPAAVARLAEIEALLDIFTNGAFGRMMTDARWKTAASTPASRSPSPPKSRSSTTR